MLDYVPNVRDQIYIPAALILIGCAITKPVYLPFGAIIAVALVWLKLQQFRLPSMLFATDLQGLEQY